MGKGLTSYVKRYGCGMNETILPLPYRSLSMDRIIKLHHRVASTPALSCGPGCIRPCGPLSDLSEAFHQAARWRSSRYGWRSRADHWVTPSFQKALRDHPRSVAEQRRILSARSYISAHWPIDLAASVIQATCARSVLDPCAGWGDRLAAALAIPFTRRYVGFDTNRLNEAGYQSQIETFSENKMDASVTLAPFEDACIQPGTFDLVMTSPPFWCLEHYSTDRDQSNLRYENLDNWLDGFLRPMISKSIDAIRSGGHLCLHSSNFLIRNQLVHLDDIVVDLCKGLDCKADKSLCIRSRSAFQNVEHVRIWRKP